MKIIVSMVEGEISLVLFFNLHLMSLFFFLLFNDQKLFPFNRNDAKDRVQIKNSPLENFDVLLAIKHTEFSF